MTRQVTAVAIAFACCFGAWSLSQGMLGDFQRPISVGIPLLIGVLGVWVAFRLVNYPRFADFLISVQAEMDKVSWTSWPELRRSAAVVIVTMFFLGFVLLMYDFFWQWLFKLIHFLEI